TPIADGKHPNLYYNQSEIDELRQMILVKHSPKHLYDRYKGEIKDAVAVPTNPDNGAFHSINLKAALGYAMEPSAAKADAIRASILSFVRAFPNGLPDWYGTKGCYFSGYCVPWMFDLILAYHPDKLLDSGENSEREGMRPPGIEWLCAERPFFPEESPCS